jgi:uncharacterized membrane protein
MYIFFLIMTITQRIIQSCLLVILCAHIPLALAQAPTDTQQSFEARITKIEPRTCDDMATVCSLLTLVGITDSFKGQSMQLMFNPNNFQSGHMAKVYLGEKMVVDSDMVQGQRTFVLSDVVRRPVLSWLLALFIIVLFVVGGWSSVRSLLGMIVSFCILFFFMFPRILAGDSPLFISLIGSIVIMATTFAISHGWNAKMWNALLGTCLSLLLTAFLAAIFSIWGQLWGLADESNAYLLGIFSNINTRGLLLAGIIIGTLGSLNDVTITQASAVFELKNASPSMKRKELAQSALRIGRDHIAGAINTLVLAYAGVSFSLLLLLMTNMNNEPWSILINRESFATEIVRTLVGSIGLLIAIPFTNFFASNFASKLPLEHIRRCCGHGGHSHV